MAEKHTIAMFKQIDGKRVQIGWASPINPDTRSRTFERSPEFLTESLDGVSFEDDEASQEFAAEHEGEDTEIKVNHNTVIEPEHKNDNYPQAGDEGKDSAPLQVEQNETVELDNGGTITEVDEEAEFERELEEEQQRLAAEQNETPQTRREARENEESN